MIKRIVLTLIPLMLCLSVNAQNYNDSSLCLSYLDSSQMARNSNKLADALNYSILALKCSKEYGSLKGRTHISMGTSLWELGAHRDAINHLYIATKFNSEDEGSYGLQEAIIFGTIGSYNLQLEKLDSSIRTFKRAIKILSKLNYTLYYASAYNNLGLAYYKKALSDSALIAYNTGLSILNNDTKKHALFASVILDNKADLAKQSGDYASAAKLTKQALAIINEKSDKPLWTRSVSYLYSLILVNDKLNNDSIIKEYSKQFFEGLAHIRIRAKHFERANNVINILINRGLGNEKFLLQERVTYADSLSKQLEIENEAISKGLIIYKRSLLEQQNKIVVLQQKEADNIIALEKSKNRRIQLITLIALAVAIGVITFIWSIARQRKTQMILMKELNILERENQKLIENELSIEVERKKSDILQLALDNAKKLEWNNELITKLQDLKKTDEKDIDKALRDIEFQMNQQLRDDNRSSVLKTKVEAVNEAFNDKLFNMYPSLTRREIELCGYLKLKLSGQEIATIKNVDPKSITKAKQRLKKKLGLDTNVDLYQHFRTF